MARDVVPGESHRNLERRTFSALLSLPIALVAATGLLVALWALLTLSVIFALLACAALVAVGLPICILLARRNWRTKSPPNQLQ
ncbi:MAG TPA: hypothetical protein VIY69_07520 [Candidatus Acidoferrales bacterium]